jgi:hypothetical protein
MEDVHILGCRSSKDNDEVDELGLRAWENSRSVPSISESRRGHVEEAHT